MTQQQHPITPPPELVQQWASESLATQNLCNRAAQWGADQEIEAICERLEYLGWHSAVQDIRDARCHKPPSLKERIKQAISSGDTGLAIKLLEDLNDTV